MAAARLGWGFIDLGKSLRWAPQPGVHHLCPLGPAALHPCLAGPKLQGWWSLSSAPDKTPGSTKPGRSSPDPWDPPPGAHLPRQLVLGAGVGTERTQFKGQGPFSSDFCVLNSKAIFQMIRKGQFGIF